jgi:hypothetical protein
LVVEGVDFVGGSEVFVGNGAVRDAGVDEGHAHGAVAEHRCDCFEAHAVVDCLSCERVAELVGVNVTDPGDACAAGNSAAHAVAIEFSSLVREQ